MPTVIEIESADPATEALWRTVIKVATALGDDHRWCLVGGLMVALFAIEAGQSQRATTDIDILTDTRARPSGTKWATDKLLGIGATVDEISGLDRERGFRLAIDGQIVDVLAPEGLGAAARTIGKLETIQIPGGSQALKRVETVQVVVGRESAWIRRPTLLGALLVKARALAVHSEPEDQRQDIVTLLSLLEDPRSAREELAGQEGRWLRSIRARLDLDDPVLAEIFGPLPLRIARAAYEVLTA